MAKRTSEKTPRTRSAPHATASIRNVPTDLTLLKGAMLLFAIAIAAYLPALRAGFIWDDDDYVTANQALRSAQGLHDIWLKLRTTPQYYPLVHTTFWIEYHAWGLWAAGYHAINVLLHTANCVLAWRVMRRLALPGALFGAAIFAAHPVFVESVAWITERKNMLSGFFYLLSLLMYLRAESPETEQPRHRWMLHLIALAAFVAAMFSKTIAFSLPAAILLLEWRRTGKIALRTVAKLIPYFAIGIGLALITATMEKEHVGAVGKEWDLSFAQRVLIAGRALWFYIGKLLWPADLIFIYPRWVVRTNVWQQWLFPIAFAILVVALVWRIPRIGRGPLTAILFFAGTLFPALGFFNVYPMRYSFVADHFQYLASLGIIALISASATVLAERYGIIRWARFAACGAVLLLAVLTFRQCLIYRDLATLWRDVLRKNPSAGIAHVNLGNLLAEREQLSDASKHFQTAIDLDAEDEFAWYGLGTMFHRQGKLAEAADRYANVVRIKPSHWEAQFQLGKVAEELRQPEEAYRRYELSLGANPNYLPARIGKASLLANKGDMASAAREYEAALKSDPRSEVALFNAAEIYMQTGNKPKAAETLRRLLAINPDDSEARDKLARLARP